MKCFLSFLIAIFVFQHSFAQNAFTGQWKTIDDETQKVKSIVELYEVNGNLHGKILKVFYQPNEPQHTNCEKCPGDKKDKPIVGLEILTGLKKDSEAKWSGGDIMDPKNGKVYSCKIELIENGQKLKVRGFIGFSLLGRTQVWERMTDEAAPAPAPAPATSGGATVTPPTKQ
jgi:uncharacterized protein (DUF2147 family)